jgi:hypothetical protein
VALVAWPAVAGLGCASEDAHFDVQTAPEFGGQPLSLSVFGVFRDGSMSADAWEQLGPKLSPSFGSPTCEVAYGKRLVESNASVAREIDDEARENGVSDELLARFAAQAKGEAILLLTVAGEVASKRDAGATGPSAGAPPPSPRGRGGRRGRSPSGMPGGRPRVERTSFEMSASLYSVQLGRAIAVVSMTYGGSSQTEALEKFRGELAKIFPHATCVGWEWDAR